MTLCNRKPTTIPVLILPRANSLYAIDTDVCGTHVGCVAQQEHGDKDLKQDGYFTKSLSDAER